MKLSTKSDDRLRNAQQATIAPFSDGTPTNENNSHLMG
jgi:hypothetical protein